MSQMRSIGKIVDYAFWGTEALHYDARALVTFSVHAMHVASNGGPSSLRSSGGCDNAPLVCTSKGRPGDALEV